MNKEDWEELKFYIKQIRGYVIRIENWKKRVKAKEEEE